MEIASAQDETAREDGLLLCPEGAATLAAWRAALRQGLIGGSDRAILFNCASPLKYPLADRSTPLDRNAPIDLAAL